MYKLYALFELLKLKNIVTQKGGQLKNWSFFYNDEFIWSV